MVAIITEVPKQAIGVESLGCHSSDGYVTDAHADTPNVCGSKGSTDTGDNNYFGSAQEAPEVHHNTEGNRKRKRN